MNMMRILYINYVDGVKLLSGSSVRPAKMLKAFKDLNYEVVILSGNQFDKNRKQKIKKIEREIELNKPDLCYIESPTYPIVKHSDRALIRKIHSKKIPMAYFYRDFYRKFPNQFPRKTGFIGHLKDYGLDLLQYLTDRVLRNCDIVYFPSMEAAKLFDYKDKRALPPAGEDHLAEEKERTHVGIYVGGVVGHYDATLLLDSCQILHRQDESFKLILVCRKDEWEQVDHPCKNVEWLEVHHASGKELEPLYRRASVAFVMPRKDIPYNEFAVSVKTFEYISYGLPVVAVNCKALSDVVEGENIGIVVKPNAADVCNAVKKILSSDETYSEFCDKIKEALLKRNLWIHRVNTIVRDLLPKKI